MKHAFNTILVDDVTGGPVADGRVVLLTPGPQCTPTRRSDGNGFSNFYASDEHAPDPPVVTEIIADAPGYEPWCTYGDPVTFAGGEQEVWIRLTRSPFA